MSDDLIERLRDFTEEDAYAMPWTFGAVVREAADEIARLRSEVERLTTHAECGWAQYRHWMNRYLGAAEDRDAATTALADERRHADALAANVMSAAACLDLLPATAIACGADEKAIEIAKSAEDYAETVDGLISAIAQHRARRQG